MQKKISLSIIIPVRNEASHLPSLLNALQIRKSDNTEVIVVDGCSEDDTLNVICQRKNRILHSEPGRAQQMNTGARHAKGEYLWFLHADSKVDFDFESVIESGLKNKKWGWFNVRLSNTKIIFRVIESMMNYRSKITSVATGDQGIFIHKNIFIEQGLFPSIALMEDVKFSKKIRSSESPFISDTPLETSARRWEENGPIRTIFKMWTLRLLFFIGVSPNWLNKQYNKK
ncbi:MAG: TIGR04283 family arsenosugar biosynthesis glycosyltransferase [Proteobacteria bacterium]|nr:TIGR04283 family arsenosugar biosynthesis glycosyltransferase [Pseudomonadota bacterium]MDA0861137.1 TIGR04283 family arsenosugar biosynthesis glycosyltransferase [Pseudomonadota bacterium]MDA1030335.1 TIGR04283 family arsenosugar biosynthesis glycosyltransferase [Pseudomonadota bacterium]